jgi:glycosyltransferase involved in cell wall biosynthesis
MPDVLPSISLVTCSYMQARFLEATIRSVIDQRYPCLEYIVMDGGSTDGSASIIERYQGYIADWVSERDGGQTMALKRGFDSSSGEIMGWLCSDDLLLPGALQAVGKYFREHPEVDVVYGDSIWIDANGVPIRAKKEMDFSRFVFLYDHNYLPQPSTFWRRKIYEKVGGLDADFNLAMDGDLWERFSQVTCIRRMDGYLSCMRYYEQQKTRSLTSQRELEDRRIRTRHESSWNILPIGVLRGMARLKRVFCKGMSGGYGVRVPEEMQSWLRGYETRAGQ